MAALARQQDHAIARPLNTRPHNGIPARLLSGAVMDYGFGCTRSLRLGCAAYQGHIPVIKPRGWRAN
ncbi:MAG: hypothetical protein K0R03_2398 [Moraxellaceae bacterium]|jgi:hypothetical protein|nr:hypothetical protein [Moraxellaceae bacterium]